MAYLFLVRRMSASTSLGPFPAPHKTKQFWRFVAGIALIVLCAPLVQGLMGLPPFPREIQIRSGIITFVTFVPLGWFGFRFGRTGWLTVGGVMFVFALWATFHG
jgi:hypothetical protein